MPETTRPRRTRPATAPTCRHRSRTDCGCIASLPPVDVTVPAPRDHDWTPWSTAFAANA